MRRRFKSQMLETADIPILYSFRRCPFAMRARMAILSAGERCELREVLLRDKPAQMIAASSKGTVPVLVLPDGEVLDESLDVMRWALGRNDPEDLLATQDEQLLSLIDGEFKYHLDRYKYATRYDDCDPLQHRQAAVAILQTVEERLGDKNWLFGDKPSYTDLAILPFVRQYRIAGEKWFDEEMPLPAVRGWLKRFLAADFFTAVMAKNAPWQEADEPIYFPA